MDEYGWDYFQGQIIKYLMRWKHKAGVQDLLKARHYLDKYIELEQAKEAKVNQDKPPELSHMRKHMTEPFVALCGADVANQITSDRIGGVTCDRCVAIFFKRDCIVQDDHGFGHREFNHE